MGRLRVRHGAGATSAIFDEENLIACAGLVPTLTLAASCGLHALTQEHVRLPGSAGASAGSKVAGLIAGMVAGADCIDGMDLLRHGGMDTVFTDVRAPSTYGTFLRAFTFGHVRQLDAAAARFLPRLAAAVPLLPGAGHVTYIDIDDSVRRTYGYAKQGAGYGYSGVKGLNFLLATLCTTQAAPVIAATRLRRGSANSARGAAKLLADALTVATATGAGGRDGTGLMIVRADSAYYNHDVVAAARRGGARFSLTVRSSPAVTHAIAAIDDDDWTPIRYPEAIWDDEEQRWISDAEVAEVAEAPFTAFVSRRKSQRVTARLIVRRVRRLNPAAVEGQQELFTAFRYHAVFTDSPLPMLQAEADHRRHAIIEQVIADLKDSALAHFPSGKFAANSAWLVLAAMAYNLSRAAAVRAGPVHARARIATIRAQLICVPARAARSARRLTLHLPRNWPRRHSTQRLFHIAAGVPPAQAA